MAVDHRRFRVRVPDAFVAGMAPRGRVDIDALQDLGLATVTTDWRGITTLTLRTPVGTVAIESGSTLSLWQWACLKTTLETFDLQVRPRRDRKRIEGAIR